MVVISNSSDVLSSPVPSLDNIRIVELVSHKQSALPECNSVFSRLFRAVGIQTDEVCEINCKSWRCPRHRLAWGRKWGSILGFQLAETPCNLLLNLTTSEPGFTRSEIEAALRYFMRAFRKRYGQTEYIKVVEANRANHSQLHFHLLLVCPDLSIPAMPSNWPNKLSWPGPLFEDLKKLWCDALHFAGPTRPPTTVIWCQPAKHGQKAANYAIGYITGKRDKDEEPNAAWKGRKLTYSRGFFSIPTSAIWTKLLERWFGPPKKVDYFWEPNCDLTLESLSKVRTARHRVKRLPKGPLNWSHIPIDQLSAWLHSDYQDYTYTDSEKVGMFEKMPIMIERRKAALFYAEHGYLPGFGPCNFPKCPNSPEIFIEPGVNGQFSFEEKENTYQN